MKREKVNINGRLSVEKKQNPYYDSNVSEEKNER